MLQRQHRFNYIYRVLCVVTGEYYIGMHSTDNLEDGYLGSGKALRQSYTTHGIFKHEFEALEFLPNKETLSRREAELVNQAVLNDPFCLNLKEGGYGGFDHLNVPNNWRGVSNLPENAGPLISKAMKRKVQNDSSFRERILKQLSDYREKVRAPFQGRKHTEETIEKMRKSAVGKSKKDKNGMYGRQWIHSQQERRSIAVQSQDLADYLAKGWTLGRKIKFA